MCACLVLWFIVFVFNIENVIESKLFLNCSGFF